MNVAIVKRPLGGGSYCGDECGCWREKGKTVLCVVDGIGHGKHAEEAAKKAVNYIYCHMGASLEDIFAGCNLALRKTRGVVMGMAIIEKKGRTLTYAGVGNTRVMIVRIKQTDPYKYQRLFMDSDYGIVGGGYKTLRPQTVPLGPGDLVVMYTDGVAEMIDLSEYGDVLRSDVKVLAERILQDWGQETDDAALLVYRNEGA